MILKVLETKARADQTNLAFRSVVLKVLCEKDVDGRSKEAQNVCVVLQQQQCETAQKCAVVR